jgi:hypothetical protein
MTPEASFHPMNEKPLAERLAVFEAMCKTEADRYVLWRSSRGTYLPIDLSSDEEMAVLIDEDDELAAAVTERMREAGVPVRE